MLLGDAEYGISNFSSFPKWRSSSLASKDIYIQVTLHTDHGI